MVYINSNDGKRDSDDSYEKMQKHGKEMGYNFPYLLDKNSLLANKFGAKTTPHVFLFDAKNHILYSLIDIIKNGIDNLNSDGIYSCQCWLFGVMICLGCICLLGFFFPTIGATQLGWYLHDMQTGFDYGMIVGTISVIYAAYLLYEKKWREEDED